MLSIQIEKTERSDTTNLQSSIVNLQLLNLPSTGNDKLRFYRSFPDSIGPVRQVDDRAGMIGDDSDPLTDFQFFIRSQYHDAVFFRKPVKHCFHIQNHAEPFQHLLTVNPSLCQMLGYNREELTSLTFMDFTHPEDLAGTLTGFIDSGKVGAIGVSNFTPAQTEALVSYLGDSVVSTQPQFSANHLDPLRDGTLDQAMRLGLRPLAWSALAGGSLATGHNIRTELMLEIDALAAREHVDRTAIALAFVLAHPSQPVAILGSQKPDRLRAATGALNVSLTRDDVYTLIEASEGEALP